MESCEREVRAKREIGEKEKERETEKKRKRERQTETETYLQMDDQVERYKSREGPKREGVGKSRLKRIDEQLDIKSLP